MTQTIVFIGNCQAATLGYVYERVVSPHTGDRVSFIESWLATDAAGHAKVAEADLVVRQVMDFAAATDDLRSDSRTVLFPLVCAPFLWPCSGSPHPKNGPAAYLDANGPYSAELGDSFLDRMMAQGVPVAQAVAEYLAADIVALRRVDRMREISLDRQRQRDAQCGGYDIADMIEARLPEVKLFRTTNHPEHGLTLYLARELFDRIGVAASILDEVERFTDQLFPATEAPIHPAIARHFGLRYADANTRYRFFDEGRYTFAEAAARYMTYSWNPDLAYGMHLEHHGDPAEAIAVLRRAIAATPRSAHGHMSLANVLEQHGDLGEAAALARRAVELDPDNAHFRARAEHLLGRAAARA